MSITDIQATLRPLLNGEGRRTLRQIERASGYAKNGLLIGLETENWDPRVSYFDRLCRVVRHYRATGEVVSAELLADAPAEPATP